MISRELLQNLIFFAGAGQIILILASVAIPKVLGWKEKLADVDIMIRQMFWVYSIYIWGTNLWFGIISVCAFTALTDGSTLAIAVNIFIAIYWGARIFIQFFYFDRQAMVSGTLEKLGEAALVLLFILLTLVYGLAAYANFTGFPG